MPDVISGQAVIGLPITAADVIDFGSAGALTFTRRASTVVDPLELLEELLELLSPTLAATPGGRSGFGSTGC